MAYDTIHHRIVMFGGAVGHSATLGDTWTFDGQEWSPRNVCGPGAHVGHTFVFDPLRHQSICFGAPVYSSLLDDGTWAWNGQIWNLLTKEGPPKRSGHGMAFDSSRGVMVLFGGGVSNLMFNDTWEWNGARWLLKASDGPLPRSGHAMAYDQQRGVVVMFGGGKYGTGQSNSETWEWNSQSWTLRTTRGPSARNGHLMAYDAVRRRTVMFGGVNFIPGQGNFSYHDTWEWDGFTWVLTAPAPPYPVDTGGAAVYDPDIGAVVAYSPPYKFRWTGSAWVQSACAGLSGRKYFAVAYDRDRHTAVLFGGESRGYNGETWEVGTTLRIAQPPQPQSVSRGRTAQFNVEIEGEPTIAFQWRFNGAALADSAHISGSKTATLSIHNVSVADAGNYDVLVTNSCGSLTSAAAHLSVAVIGTPGDVTGEGLVNIDDLVAVITAWGPCSISICPADVNADGVVNIDDLIVVISHWS
jgi:hypothetical protein